MEKESIDKLVGWFAGRLPDGWFTSPPDITYDRDEILVIGTLAEADVGKDASTATRSAAARSRAESFREDTRSKRMEIASDAEHTFERKVSWGVSIGGERTVYTTASVPVMTRLGLDERLTLDTLVDAGVARSRSDALKWCVRLASKNEADWIAQLRDALGKVEEVRDQAPPV